MKCAAMLKKKKAPMSKEDRAVYKQLESRYLKLRMTMSHKKAMEQLKREAEDAGLASKNTEDNGVVHEAGSDNIEE